jgi:hypothetical protein
MKQGPGARRRLDITSRSKPTLAKAVVFLDVGKGGRWLKRPQVKGKDSPKEMGVIFTSNVHAIAARERCPATPLPERPCRQAVNYLLRLCRE